MAPSGEADGACMLRTGLGVSSISCLYGLLGEEALDCPSDSLVVSKRGISKLKVEEAGVALRCSVSMSPGEDFSKEEMEGWGDMSTPGPGRLALWRGTRGSRSSAVGSAFSGEGGCL